jgi:putative tricarboxylic transport membrane protein
MDFLSNLASGFVVALNPWNLIFAFLGAFIGTAIGVLPALGPATTIALLLPVTYGMDATSAFIMTAGVYYGAMYGGSTTSILLNIPGEVASVVTCLDGYQMARQGRAGPALGISAMGSFIAGTMGVLLMSVVAPALASIALKFGPVEYSALIFLGLLMAVYLAGDDILKGLIMATLGLLLGAIGLDPAMGIPRFDFGIPMLLDGINFIPVAMGVFGLSEVFINLKVRETHEVFETSLKGILPNREDWKRSWAPIMRGSFIGFLVGILPGGGAVISTFMSYTVEKKLSKHPETFGCGAIEGVASPESANNAASTSSFIPLLTLGIPANNAMAMLFVALMIHGINPGPLLLSEHPNLFWGVIASMYIGNVMLLGLNLPLIGFWVRLLKVPYHHLAAMIVIIVMIGAYNLRNSTFDLATLIFFGVMGYIFRKSAFPFAPLVLSLILGPRLETALQQSLTLSGADPFIFFKKPISATLLAGAALVILIPVIKWAWKRVRRASSNPPYMKNDR